VKNCVATAETLIEDRRVCGSSLYKAIIASVVAHSLLFVQLEFGDFSLRHDGVIQRPHTRAVIVARQSQPDKAISLSPTLLEDEAGSKKTLSSPTSQRQNDLNGDVDEPSHQSTLGMNWERLYYFPLVELSRRPTLITRPDFKISEISGQVEVNGHVRIEVLVENTGRVNAVRLVHTDLPYPYPQKVMQAFQKVSYTPGMKDGLNVRTRILIEATYIDGVLNNDIGQSWELTFPDEGKPHTPITLPENRHQRKQNPSMKP